MVRCTTAVRLRKIGQFTRRQPSCYLFNSCLRKRDKRQSHICFKFSVLTERLVPAGTAFAMN
jgi:hypothetical protein